MASIDRQRREVSVEQVIVDAGRGPAPEALRLRQPPEVCWLREADSGIYDALNKGISLSSAAVIGQLNADEQSLPGALRWAQEQFQRHPEIDVLFGDYILVDAQGRPLGARREIPGRGTYLRHGVNSILTCATFFRRSVWERIGPFDTSLKLLGDKDWYLRALASGVRFRHTRRYLGLFTLDAHNASRDLALARREQDTVRRRHGGAGPGIRHFAVRACRRFEKLMRGCYGPHRVRYDYCRGDGCIERVTGWTGSRWRAG